MAKAVSGGAEGRPDEFGVVARSDLGDCGDVQRGVELTVSATGQAVASPFVWVTFPPALAGPDN